MFVYPRPNHQLIRYYIDKIRTGFIAWSKTIKVYKPVSDGDKFLTREAGSQPQLQVIYQTLKGKEYLRQLSALWGQESNKTGSFDIRSENVLFIKYLGKCALHLLADPT